MEKKKTAKGHRAMKVKQRGILGRGGQKLWRNPRRPITTSSKPSCVRSEEPGAIWGLRGGWGSCGCWGLVGGRKKGRGGQLGVWGG